MTKLAGLAVAGVPAGVPACVSAGLLWRAFSCAVWVCEAPVPVRVVVPVVPGVITGDGEVLCGPPVKVVLLTRGPCWGAVRVGEVLIRPVKAGPTGASATPGLTPTAKTVRLSSASS